MEPSPTNLHIGKRIRRRRRLLGLTLHQLGEKTDIRYQQVQKYEIAQNRVTADRLYQIAHALDVPISYFFEGLESTSGIGQVSVANDQDEELLAMSEGRAFHSLARLFRELSYRGRQRLLELAKMLDEDAA